MKHPIKINTVIAAFSENLPGESAHQLMIPQGRSLIIPEDKKPVKQSAVLLLLFPDNGQLMLCLTQRNNQLKHHPGQISFPGGRCEKNEYDPLVTALRETEEEIGVKSKDIQIIGKLSSLYVSVSNFNIHPFLGWIEEKPSFIINKSEVEDLILVPIDSFFDKRVKSNHEISTTNGTINVPCYNIKNLIIWGATSMMIAELEVLLETHYSRLEEH